MVELLVFSEYDTVMTIVDLVSKQAQFLLIHTIVTVERVARLFLHYIWKLYRLFRKVVLD